MTSSTLTPTDADDRTADLTTAAAFEPGTASIGIIGNRHLVAVQTFDVSRLTTHPVPLVPGSFIAVSGMGPKGDSNGSGKTSFLAAVSLLLGDAQWRLEAAGSQDAPKLLFSPASAGLAADSGYASATTGYVVGVFAEPDDPVETAITVWLRLSSTPQFLRARWATGLHVASGDTDTDRYEQADALWNSLPKDTELGPKKLREALYGTAPRAIAYVDTSMRKSAPSLLSQQMTEMSPEQIGVALIELTGRQGLLDTEERQRGLLATQEAELRSQQEQDRVTRAEEEVDLEAVHNRDLARRRLADGEHLWRLHFAAGYLSVLKDADDLRVVLDDLDLDLARAREAAEESRRVRDDLRGRTDLAEAEVEAKGLHEQASNALREADLERDRVAGTLRRLTEEKTGLRERASRWSGISADDAEAEVSRTDEARRGTDYALRDASRDRDTARTSLDAARAGSGGEAAPTLQRLAEAGVEARLLLDEVTLTETARAAWEPRLWAHRDSVVIAAADRDRALSALTGTPGATVVVCDGALDEAPTGLPEGVHATVPATGFLRTLAARTEHVTGPDRAVDAGMREHVLGGFTHEIAGRAARIAAAEQALFEAEQAHERAQLAHQTATSTWEIAVEDLDAATAAARITVIDTQTRSLTETISGLDATISERTATETATSAAWVRAAANAQSHHDQVKVAEQRLKTDEAEVTRLNGMHREKATELGNLRVDYWAAEWGDTPEAAQSFLDEQPDSIGSLRRRSLMNRSAEVLKEALDAYTRNLSEVPSDLRRALEQRQRLADGEPGLHPAAVSFESVAAPLRDLLDARLETDQMLEGRILRQRTDRETRIAAMEAETREKHDQWDAVQDMIGARIEEALKKISASLNRLVTGRGGFGAELKIAETRPQTPTSTWKWEVTPRWRRSSSGPMIDYKKVANGAQVKVFAIQLVLAALLADEGARGRVLIIDELGNSLGDVHRQDVLRDLNEVAADQDVTIIGTCQDSVIGDAAGVCGQILWFSHANEADAYNQPTRMWGYDPNGERVRLTADWLIAGRTDV